MTPRERVLAAVNHQPTDRVPIDFGGHRSSGIAAIAYRKLREALDLPRRPIRVYDPIQQLAIVDDDVLDRFDIDTIELGRGFATEDEHWNDWTLPDGSPCQMPAWATPEREEGRWVLKSESGRVLGQMPDGAIYFEQTYWPFFEEDDLDGILDAMGECMWIAMRTPPGPLAAGQFGDEAMVEGARNLRARTDRAILALFGGNLLQIGQVLYRNDKFFQQLAGEPQRAH
ncbi:MAG: methyltransferase, partial [Candidatus Nealsonbacteria bacterium]|nr:methyltransferase [Candidatus Nealsonbacteria bacterium]